jgi:DNA-binding NarL/FixJ family response regulator
MTTLPTVLVANGSSLPVGLRRALDDLGLRVTDDRAAGRVDVALVVADPTADLPAQIRELLAHSADHVVVVAQISDPSLFVAAVAAGADGWVLPSIDPAALARTLRGVRDGESGFSRLDMVLLVQALRADQNADAGGVLTQRERQVHRAMRTGESFRQIAEVLELTEATVRWHAHRITRKLAETGPPRSNTRRSTTTTPGPVGRTRTERARTVLTTVDSRPSTVNPGVSELGRAELRVVELVAEGLNNREIAERLFLSRHTVESHLKRVYAKLQIRSRVELTRLMLEAEATELAS